VNQVSKCRERTKEENETHSGSFVSIGDSNRFLFGSHSFSALPSVVDSENANPNSLNPCNLVHRFDSVSYNSEVDSKWDGHVFEGCGVWMIKCRG